MTEEQKDLQAVAAKAAQTTSAEADENFDWEAYANDDVTPASEKMLWHRSMLIRCPKWLKKKWWKEPLSP